MNNLAMAYWSARQLDRSLPLLEETLKRQKAKLGFDHPDTLLTMANLGGVYRDAGRTQEAISLLETVLQRGSQRALELPATLAWVPGTLAETYGQAGQFDKAEAIHRDALMQARKRFGSDDPRTASAIAQLSANLLKQKKFTEAESLLRQCLRVRWKNQRDSWTYFNTQSLMGEALAGQKKYPEAQAVLLSGYRGMKEREAKIPAIAKVRLTEALQRLVLLYDAWNKKDKAAEWRKELEAQKEKEKK